MTQKHTILVDNLFYNHLGINFNLTVQSTSAEGFRTPGPTVYLICYYYKDVFEKVQLCMCQLSHNHLQNM